MTTLEAPSTAQVKQNIDARIERVRELYAAGPEMGRKALETMLRELKSDSSGADSRMASAGRTGSRQGKVSERR